MAKYFLNLSGYDSIKIVQRANVPSGKFVCTWKKSSKILPGQNVKPKHAWTYRLFGQTMYRKLLNFHMKYFLFIRCVDHSRLLPTIKLEKVVCNSGQTNELKTNVVANGQ